MKIDVKISNLGKLKEGVINIRPVTVLTGSNGTGKSFFTKSLYSMLNVINKNVYHIELNRNISFCKILLDSLKNQLTYRREYDEQQLAAIYYSLDTLQEQLDYATELKLEEYFNYAKSQVSFVAGISSEFSRYLASLSNTPKKKKSIKTSAKELGTLFNRLQKNLENGQDIYIESLTDNLDKEIKENFQISDLSELVSFGEKKSRIEIDALVHIEFGKLGVGFHLKNDFINKVSSLSRVVFFESPAYWKVRDALKSAKNHAELPIYLRGKNKKLTGVPQYFYDLDAALKEHVTNQRPENIDDLTKILESELGGEFVFSGDDLLFKDYSANKEISKNLISFGMTNLGMIHALLKNNVITSGSFVFIDEPETNLHPKWQVLLMDILVQLAERDINIVIATHSIDMLKALEVNLKDKPDDIDQDFMSINYFDSDGTLLDFEADDSLKQLIEARNELASSYETLYFKGCK